MQLFSKQTLDLCQPVNAVYYRNTALAARITGFMEACGGNAGQPSFIDLSGASRSGAVIPVSR